MARSGSGISAIFASTSLSPSAFAAARGRLQLLARSFIAARSSSVNPAFAFSHQSHLRRPVRW